VRRRHRDVDRVKQGAVFRDKVKHIGRNDQLFVTMNTEYDDDVGERQTVSK